MMMGSELRQLFAGVVNYEDLESQRKQLVSVARTAVSMGFTAVLTRPNEKAPTCTVAPTKRKRDGHACGIKHATNDPKELNRALTVLLKEFPDGVPNLGVVPGPSGFVVVDLDTAEQVKAFRTLAPDVAITVRSPGSRTPDGTWAHRDGGHAWLRVPDGFELPTEFGKITDPSGWVALWSGAHVLVPPSRRPEGLYRLVGEPGILSQSLSNKIIAKGEAATARTAERERRRTTPTAPAAPEADPIDTWATATPWRTVLSDWSPAGHDRCGCEVFTAPGGHASPKSATAHEGCDRADDTGRLQVWTDDPPAYLVDAGRGSSGRSFSKLDVIALRDYDGDHAQAMEALGIERFDSTLDPDTYVTPDDDGVQRIVHQLAENAIEDDIAGDEAWLAGDVDGAEEYVDPYSWMPTGLTDSQKRRLDRFKEDAVLRKYAKDQADWEYRQALALSSPTESRIVSSDNDDEDEDLTTMPPLVGMVREDGAHLLYPASWHTVVGPTSTGKSWIAVVSAIQVLESESSVVYVHFEESERKRTVARFVALVGRTRWRELRERFYWISATTAFADGEFATTLAQIEGPTDLLVLDGINAAATMHGYSPNDAETVGWYRREFVAPATRIGAAVMSLGHPVKDQMRKNERHGYGASGWLDEVDGVAYRTLFGRDGMIRPGEKGAALIYVVKDRQGGALSAAAHPKDDGWAYWGKLVIEPAELAVDTGPVDAAMSAAVHAPRENDEDAPAGESDSHRRDADAVARFVGEHPGCTSRELREGMSSMSSDRVDAAVQALINAGRVVRTKGDRNAWHHRLAEDPQALEP